MIGRFDPRHKTMSLAIARHKRACVSRATIDRQLKSAWSLLRYPALAYVRWRENRALSKLMVIAPVDADDAREKLIYILAAIMADRSLPDGNDITFAIATLKPFRGTLFRCLKK
ncbi:MAG: hypothetical protein KGZ68_07975 [Dechloromonas sp.]|jgi:hypothetical protein|nr:hypothetical protein [Dechloromonas sp.]